MFVCHLLCQSEILFFAGFTFWCCVSICCCKISTPFSRKKMIKKSSCHTGLLYIGSYELHFYCMSAAFACKNSLNLEVITPFITEYLMLLLKIDLQPLSMPLFSTTDWNNNTEYKLGFQLTVTRRQRDLVVILDYGF